MAPNPCPSGDKPSERWRRIIPLSGGGGLFPKNQQKCAETTFRCLHYSMHQGSPLFPIIRNERKIIIPITRQKMYSRSPTVIPTPPNGQLHTIDST